MSFFYFLILVPATPPVKLLCMHKQLGAV